MPLLVEKTLTIKKNGKSLTIDEKLTNEAGSPLNIMWGHHIAFGIELLGDGGQIETSATKFEAESAMPENRFFKPGILQDWPNVLNIHGKQVEGGAILPSTEHFSDLGYLSSFQGDAYYKIHTKQMEFSVHWDKEIFKSLWYWQERYATPDAPWWGKAYAIALEPWTSKWLANPSPQDIENQWLCLAEGETLSTTITAHCKLK